MISADMRLPGLRSVTALRERILLAEAALCLLGAKIVVSFAPFRWYARGFTSASSDKRPLTEDTDPRTARQVAWAISGASARLPFKCTCLVEALGGRFMMRRRGLPSTLRLGVSPRSADLSAHAWLESGDVTITGKREAAGHNTVAVLK